jgi:hypothetical protein
MRLYDMAGFDAVRLHRDHIPLWYTSGFEQELRGADWNALLTRTPRQGAIYLLSAPVFLGARIAGRGDSMIVSGSRPRPGSADSDTG